jgi:hypothetical protein
MKEIQMKTILVTTVLFLALLVGVNARAGTFMERERDGTHLLNSGDLSYLTNASRTMPFDLRVLFETTSSVDELETDAHEAVASANVVVVAIDPSHHKTIVRFGTATGVKAGDFDSISKAGNAHFRSGEWAAGIEAIAIRAKASRDAVVALSQSNEPVVVQGGLDPWAWGLIAALVVGFAGLALWIWRKGKHERAQYEKVLNETTAEAQELRSRNIKEADWESKIGAAAPTAPASASRVAAPVRRQRGRTVQTVAVPQPQVIVRDGGNDFLTGMLVGESMNRPAPTTVVEREVVHERDSGGSSSSYDSGSSSSDSSSSDSGGSSSSWDSGGGSFDSGGGGFDSGGGGFDGGGSGSSW